MCALQGTGLCWPAAWRCVQAALRAPHVAAGVRWLAARMGGVAKLRTRLELRRRLAKGPYLRFRLMTRARPSSSIDSSRRPSGETAKVRICLAFSNGRVELTDCVRLICGATAGALGANGAHAMRDDEGQCASVDRTPH